MAKLSKRMQALQVKKTALENARNLEEIINILKESCTAKFVESIDLAIGLGVNPRKSDENIRGSLLLAHGIPKKQKIAAFVLESEADAVKKAGADVIGLTDLMEEIKKTGKADYDYCFASTNAFPKILPIAKILGQNGVMPNKKDGTVADNVAAAIIEVKAGRKCNFRNDDAAYLHFSVGKADMDTSKIIENIKEALNHIRGIKPSKVKEMIKKIYISTTMGLGCKISQSMV